MPRALTAVCLFLAACAADPKKDANTANDAKKEDGPSNTPTSGGADRSRCDPSGKEVTSLDINGDKKPDVWKFYASTIENGAKVQVLTCKEVDLNFDGKKDMWVYYDNAGDVTLEEFDLDFDGRTDLWTYRTGGKIVRQRLRHQLRRQAGHLEGLREREAGAHRAQLAQHGKDRRVGILRGRQARSHRLRHLGLGPGRPLGPRARRGGGGQACRGGHAARRQHRSDAAGRDARRGAGPEEITQH